MRDTSAERLIHEITSQLSLYGIACTERQASLLARHLRLVIEKNKVINLTRIVDPLEAVSLHIVDSLLPLASDVFVLGSSDFFLDMGTGAGFPGIPLGVMTEAHGMLVDSVGKKVEAVDEFTSRLGLSKLHTRHARLEDLACEMRASQDMVCARAVAQTNVLIEYATPFLKMGGHLVIEKGRPAPEEIDAALHAGDICGLTLVSRESFELPQHLGHREILFFEKVKPSRIALPRKVGEAKRRPLGIE